MWATFSSLGFASKLVRIDSVGPKTLMVDVKASLDAGRPMLVATRSHAMVLILILNGLMWHTIGYSLNAPAPMVRGLKSLRKVFTRRTSSGPNELLGVRNP